MPGRKLTNERQIRLYDWARFQGVGQMGGDILIACCGAAQLFQNQTYAVLDIEATAARLRDRVGLFGKSTLRTS